MCDVSGSFAHLHLIDDYEYAICSSQVSTLHRRYASESFGSFDVVSTMRPCFGRSTTRPCRDWLLCTRGLWRDVEAIRYRRSSRKTVDVVPCLMCVAHQSLHLISNWVFRRIRDGPFQSLGHLPGNSVSYLCSQGTLRR